MHFAIFAEFVDCQLNPLSNSQASCIRLVPCLTSRHLAHHATEAQVSRPISYFCRAGRSRRARASLRSSAWAIPQRRCSCVRRVGLRWKFKRQVHERLIAPISVIFYRDILEDFRRCSHSFIWLRAKLLEHFLWITVPANTRLWGLRRLRFFQCC
jgi:hypothetical protein